MDPKSPLFRQKILTSEVTNLIQAYINKGRNYYWSMTPTEFIEEVEKFGDRISIGQLKILINSKVATPKMIGTANGGLTWIYEEAKKLDRNRILD